ncbi:hypothetical protein CMO83_02110 [Candidatus Woesearchaeota archaeon]|jgi:hypothetical protein|nr:hypothetical protein [Candidatus Woesearchaeota archaeon]|tara:strand:+ start:6738 stop:7181 length:444 start_codon:yes stop_codon:yes gene_type:complete
MKNKRGLKFLSSKKGYDIELWFNVFELTIVFVVIGLLFQTVNAEVKASTFEKLYLARDNAFLLNTIYASPGDIQYYYVEDTGDFILDFKKNEVDVYLDYELIERGSIGYPFAEDLTYSLSYIILDTSESLESRILYEKENDIIDVTN